MSRHSLTDKEWNAIRDFLAAERSCRRERRSCSHRQIISGILWILATGASWRDVPKEFGKRGTVYGRFLRWNKEGLWDRIHRRPLRRFDHPGRIDRCVCGVDGRIIRAVVRGKVYRSNAIREWLQPGNIKAAIPERSNEHRTGRFSAALCRRRNVVERTIRHHEEYRRVITRFDKHASNCPAFIKHAATSIMLKSIQSTESSAETGIRSLSRWPSRGLPVRRSCLSLWQRIGQQY